MRIDSLKKSASSLKSFPQRLNFSYLCIVIIVTSVKNQHKFNRYYISKMKKIVLTMVALLSMTVMQAQNNDKCECKKEQKARKPMTPESMTEKMTKDLSLTDAQKTKVLALNKEYKDMFAKGPKMGGPRPQKPKADAETGATEQRPERPQLTDEQKAEMKQMKAQREEYNKKLKNILNDDQYKKYEKMQKRHGRHGHGGHHGHHGGPRGPRPDMGPQD